MIDALPEYSNVEINLASLVGKLAAPDIKKGDDMELALLRAYPIAAQQMKDAGYDPTEVDAAVARQAGSYTTFPDGETTAMSGELEANLLNSFVEALSFEGEGAVRLDEKEVQEETGFRMFIYPNESKHAGFPHVTVQLQDGKINISLEVEPRVVAGKRNLRGEAAALKAVKSHREAIRKEWFAMRPDDQKLKDQR